MTYCVFLRDFDVAFSIGVHAFEKTARQRLRINVSLLLPTPEGLDDAAGVGAGGVVDYDFLRNGILSLAEAPHLNLQETICLRIVELCRTAAGGLGCFVQTEKLDVYPDAQGVGCRMIWFGDESLRSAWAPLLLRH
jgi:dihydroneopterin aldolase